MLVTSFPWSFWVVIFGVLGLVATLLYLVMRKFNQSVINSIVIGVAISICFIVFAFIGLVVWIISPEFSPCRDVPGKSFHYYHDHLTSLCVNREDKAECPRDTSQLEAFNPDKWQLLNKCAEVQYSFSEEEQTFEFKVREGRQTWYTTTALDEGFTFGRQ